MKVKNISHTYPSKQLFKDLSFDTEQHSLVWIKGGNGSGKSTLIKILLGIIELQEGVITREKTIGYVPDSSEVYFVGLSPEMLFLFLKKQLKIDNQSFHERLEELVAIFELSDTTLKQTIKDLSLGEKKKTMLIAAFLSNAQLYIMDEPFSGLDERILASLSNYIHQLREQGKKFIIVSHGYEELFNQIDHLIEL